MVLNGVAKVGSWFDLKSKMRGTWSLLNKSDVSKFWKQVERLLEQMARSRMAR